jgi:putative aldouronate transport system permease protein
MKIKKTFTEKLEDVMIYLALTISGLTTLYPFIYVASMSISGVEAVNLQKVWLYPIDISFKAYGMILNNSNIWGSYYNTLWYTVVGTFINLVMTILGAYPLSRREFFARNFIMVFIVFTMFVSGGLIPSFILVNKLGLYNTRWAIVLPAAVGTMNIILMRIYFMTSIPLELIESAKIDGCNDIGILLKIILPLSKPIIAVITLFVAVGFWNSYFTAVLYLPNSKLQPVTILLQKILISNQTNMLMDPSVSIAEKQALYSYGAQLKYSTVIVTILPIVCVYPFLQKYFVKGIMLGALKG